MALVDQLFQVVKELGVDVKKTELKTISDVTTPIGKFAHKKRAARTCVDFKGNKISVPAKGDIVFSKNEAAKKAVKDVL